EGDFRGIAGLASGPLTIDDSGDSANAIYTITSTTVQINNQTPIPYTGATNLTVMGGSGNNTFNVVGTSASTPVTLVTDAGLPPGFLQAPQSTGFSVVNVTPTSQSLSNLAGALTVQGNSATQLIVNDQSDRFPVGIYSINSTGISSVFGGTIH